MTPQFVRWIGAVAGLLIVIWTAQSVLRSLIVPRGLASRLAAIVSRNVRGTILLVANRFDTYVAKDAVMALQAPVFLVFLLASWLALFLIGYALMLWPLIGVSFGDALLESGSSMFTLGFAGTHEVGATSLHFLAAATGLIVVALQIAYLPTLYAAFNRRETVVTILQSRAGAPAWGPEILARHQAVGIVGDLAGLYAEWERWAADVAESHTNYPVLIFFRSPHALRSWVLGLLAVMDSAALYLALSPSLAPTQARLCVRMGFTCLRSVADVLDISYDTDPFPEDPIELTYEEFTGGVRRLEEVGFPIERPAQEAWSDFKGWRVNYESIAYMLADLVVAPPGPWSGGRNHLPELAIIPQRPADRRPDDTGAKARPRGQGTGW
ncbi:MAG: hypothetical protein ABR529_11790 [Actinomycetota bacterium]